MRKQAAGMVVACVSACTFEPLELVPCTGDACIDFTHCQVDDECETGQQCERGVCLFEVQLRSSHGQLHLFVRDQGIGFDVADARRGPGIGLLSMEERIQMVNGQIAIESQPGRGTSIHARVPISG